MRTRRDRRTSQRRGDVGDGGVGAGVAVAEERSTRAVRQQQQPVSYFESSDGDDDDASSSSQEQRGSSRRAKTVKRNREWERSGVDDDDDDDEDDAGSQDANDENAENNDEEDEDEEQQRTRSGRRIRRAPQRYQVSISVPKTKKPKLTAEEPELDLDDLTARRQAFLLHHRDVFKPLLGDYANSIFAKMGRRRSPSIIPRRSRDETITPKSIKATLKDYQLDGLSFLSHLVDNGMSGILGDEMGLGKTVQTLSLLAYMKDSGIPGPYLVVCPLSVLTSWELEIKKWFPDLSYMRFHGIAHERARVKEKYRTKKNAYELLLTTYEQFTAEQSWFRHKMFWSCVILDEGHKIKNEKTNVSMSLFGIKSRHRFVLTGTPLQNDLKELWSLLHWLYPDVFTDNTADFFGESFNLTRGSYNLKVMEDARRLLEVVMLRRQKHQVDLNIPPKEELIVYLPITPLQRFWYKRLLTRMSDATLDELFSSTKDSKYMTEDNKEMLKTVVHNDTGEWRKLMNLLMQLRKVCDHPYLLPNSEPEPFENGEHMILASSKLMFLDKLLPGLIKDGHRIIIFTQFTLMLDLLEDYMIYREFRYARLDGSTSRPRRNLDIRLFQRKSSPYDVFIISTRAGGLGINLTAADTCIMIDSDWNPQNDLQATARCHRIGQTKPVKIYRTICEDTVEQQMLTRLQKKLFLSLKVGSTSTISQDEDADSSLTRGDLVSILRYGSSALASEADAEAFANQTAEEIIAYSIKHQKQIDERFKDSAAARLKKSVATSSVDADGDAEEEDNDDDLLMAEFLKGAEQIKSRLFEGVVVEKKYSSFKDISDEWQQFSKRERRQRTVTVGGGHTVLAELQNCQQWEAAPTFANGGRESYKGQDAVPAKRTKRRFDHQPFCLECGCGDDEVDVDDRSKNKRPQALLNCSGCPRSFHPRCAGHGRKGVGGSFFCSQHCCSECRRNTADCGGLLFRCGTCPKSWCEDCLPGDDEGWEEIGDNLEEFVRLGYEHVTQAYFIRCHICVKAGGDSKLIDSEAINSEGAGDDADELILELP